MSDIAIGIIGTGGMGTRHAMNLRNHIVGARVAAIYDLDQARATNVAGACESAIIFGDPHQLIRATSVDAVVIASPDDTHAEFVMACLKQGKPVLCEKPLAAKPSEALKVVEAECAIGKHLISLGFMRRFDPQHVGVQQAVAAGTLGRPLLFKGHSRNPSIPYALQTDTILSNSVIHDFDAMRWLMDEEVKEVYVCGVRTHATFSEHTHDLLLIQMSLGGTCLATIEAYLSSDYGYDISAQVVCERGVAETLDSAVARIRYQKQQVLSVPQDWLIRFQTAYVIELQHWVNALHSGDVFTGANAWDGYMAAQIADSCMQSLRSGQPICVQSATKPSLYEAKPKIRLGGQL